MCLQRGRGAGDIEVLAIAGTGKCQEQNAQRRAKKAASG